MSHAWARGAFAPHPLEDCLRDGTSLLPSRVWSSKRETKLDIGLLSVPVLQSTQLLDLSRDVGVPCQGNCRRSLRDGRPILSLGRF